MATLHLSAFLRAGLAACWVCGGAPAQAQAPTFKVGDVVECDGSLTGTVKRTKPRPGWDEPFYIVYSEGSTTNNEIRCLPRRMRALGAGADRPVRHPPAGAQAAAPPPSRQPADAHQSAAAAVPDGRYRCHKMHVGYGTLAHPIERTGVDGCAQGRALGLAEVAKTAT